MENQPAKLAFFKAFNKCQGALDPVKADSENPHFHNRYPSLAAVMDAVKPFIEDGFSFIHEGTTIEGKAYLKTSLIYGDYERVSNWPLVDDGNPQHLASSATYAKRYSISGLTGLVIDTDDDGNAAVQTVTRVPAKTQTQAPVKTPESAGFEVARFIPSKVDFVEGKGKGAGKTFSEIYRSDGAKFSGTEHAGEVAESARKNNQEIIVSFEKKGNYMNIKRDGVKIADSQPDAETEPIIEEVPF